MKRALASAVLLLFASVGIAAPGVRGVVRTLQRPLEGVHVVIPEAGRFGETDSLGRYDLGPLGPGLYSLTIVAVGYESAGGTVTVRADSSSDAADWLLKPLRPDGGGVGSFPIPPAPSAPASPGLPVPDARQLGMRQADSLLADSLTKLPGPGPLTAPLGLYLTPEEQAVRGTLPGALGELLPQIATADSITGLTGGTGAPGYESWRQWSERIAPQASDTLSGNGVTARRALAYTRTRAALAVGSTYSGWQAAKLARSAIAAARRDGSAGDSGQGFLDEIGARLDLVFIPGTAPTAPPKPAQGKKKRSHRR